jgi:hypothetical protein
MESEDPAGLSSVEKAMTVLDYTFSHPRKLLSAEIPLYEPHSSHLCIFPDEDVAEEVASSEYVDKCTYDVLAQKYSSS